MLGWGQLGTLTAVGAARSRDKHRTKPSMCFVHSVGKAGLTSGMGCPVPAWCVHLILQCCGMLSRMGSWWSTEEGIEPTGSAAGVLIGSAFAFCARNRSAAG